MIMDEDKAFFAQCLPEFKGSRALKNNKYLVEKNYKTYTVNTAIQKVVFSLNYKVLVHQVCLLLHL
jgi:hypothetical protein